MREERKGYKKRYDTLQFKKILEEISDKDYVYFENDILNYMKTYPNDPSSLLIYILYLIINNRIKEALEMINKLETLELNEEDMRVLFYHKLRILIIEGKYQEAYDMIKNDSKYFYTSSFNNLDLEIMLFLKQKLGISVNERLDGETYVQRQLIEYDKSDYLRYVSYKKDFASKLHVYFNCDFPLEKIQERIEAELPTPYPIHERITTVSYIFKYDKCGTIDGVETDYFLVSTIEGTNNILTMYPYDNVRKRPFVNINDFRYDIVNTKTKTLTQVDKFKKRYHLD